MSHYELRQQRNLMRAKALSVTLQLRLAGRLFRGEALLVRLQLLLVALLLLVLAAKTLQLRVLLPLLLRVRQYQSYHPCGYPRLTFRRKD